MQTRWLAGSPPQQGARGVFETLRWDGRESAVLPLHVARWERGCAALGLHAADLRQILAQLPNVAGEELRVRATAYETGAVEVAWRPLLADEWTPAPWRLRVLGRVAGQSESMRACKTTALWSALSWRSDARALAADDALLRGPDGSWAETTTANLLCGLHDGRIVTPWPAAMPLPGTTLEWLQTKMHVEPIRLDETLLPQIQWAVLTNAIVLLRPVVAIDDVSLAAPPPHILAFRNKAR